MWPESSTALFAVLRPVGRANLWVDPVQPIDDPEGMKLVRTIAAVAFFALGAGCVQQGSAPKLASSAGQTGYAIDYPNAVHAARKDLIDVESESSKLADELGGFAEQLGKDADAARAKEIIEAAAAEGQTAEYAERAGKLDAARRFFEEEKEPLMKKVGGATQYAVKKAGCKADTFGAASTGLEKGVEEQLEERLREKSEAHRLIDESETLLGKPAAEKLRDQADTISRASYLSRVELRRAGARLSRVMEDADAVRNTLDKIASDARKVSESADFDDATKKAAHQRALDADKSKRMIDGQLSQSKLIVEQLDDRIEKAERQFDEALEKLIGTLESPPA